MFTGRDRIHRTLAPKEAVTAIRKWGVFGQAFGVLGKMLISMVTCMAKEETLDFLPPPGPPPLLSFNQVRHFSYHGWLPIDLPESLQSHLSDISSAAASYFELGHDEKQRLYPQSRGTECGFYHVPEEKEYLTIRHSVHDDSSLERYVREAWQEAGRLLYRILCDLSRAGFFNPSAWDDLVEGAMELPLDGSGMDENITLMRLFRYYAGTGFADAHVDVGLLTLCIGNGKGLQVWDRTFEPPQWIDAEGPTILAGDMVRALFDHKVVAGRHRVVGNPEGRSSIVFALRPCLKGDIDLERFGGQGVVATKDYFYDIKASKTNINATKDIRDEQLKAKQKRKDQLREGLG